jgi:hypothetical protein
MIGLSRRDKHSARLHRELDEHVSQRAWISHMVHHAAPEEVGRDCRGERKAAGEDGDPIGGNAAAMRATPLALYRGRMPERERITAAAANSGEQAFSRQASLAFAH